MAVAVAAALLLAAVFRGDSVWTAVAALAVVGAWSALALAGRVPLRTGGGPMSALLLAVAAWSGLSIAWSVAPDRSWAELDRTLVYLAFLALGLLLGSTIGARRAAQVLAVVLGAAVAWALAGKAVPALFEDGGRAARLRDPIGYWNALALAADILLVLALSLAASARSAAFRAGGAVLAYAAVVAVLLTASRAGVAGAVLGVGLVLRLRRDRVETALLALAAALPAAAVAAWTFTRPALVDDGAARGDRVADGAWFALLLVLGAGVAALVARELARRPLGVERRRLVGRALGGLALAAALVVAVGLVAKAGSIADEFEVRNDPGRFLTISPNNRGAWWRESVDVFAADPVTGAGANTFEIARKRYRENASSVTQPHSVPLQFLAGTGLVGLLLFAGLVAAAAGAAVGAVRRLEGGERDAAAALAVALALWLLHALVDYPWDFLAVTGPVLVALGVLATAGRELVLNQHKLASLAAAALAVAAVVSVATPWLAERSVREADVALGRGDLAGAREAAERARSLDPLSLEPVFARARVEEEAADEAAALAAYRRAADVQPENPESWYQLGLYEFHLGDRCSAYVHLNRSYTLDPAATHWTPDSELEQSLDWVNEPGNCG